MCLNRSIVHMPSNRSNGSKLIGKDKLMITISLKNFPVEVPICATKVKHYLIHITQTPQMGQQMLC